MISQRCEVSGHDVNSLLVEMIQCSHCQDEGCKDTCVRKYPGGYWCFSCCMHPNVLRKESASANACNYLQSINYDLIEHQYELACLTDELEAAFQDVFDGNDIISAFAPMLVTEDAVALLVDLVNGRDACENVDSGFAAHALNDIIRDRVLDFYPLAEIDDIHNCDGSLLEMNILDRVEEIVQEVGDLNNIIENERRLKEEALKFIKDLTLTTSRILFEKIDYHNDEDRRRLLEPFRLDDDDDSDTDTDDDDLTDDTDVVNELKRKRVNFDGNEESSRKKKKTQ